MRTTYVKFCSTLPVRTLLQVRYAKWRISAYLAISSKQNTVSECCEMVTASLCTTFGHKIVLWVFSVDPYFNGMSSKEYILLLKK